MDNSTKTNCKYHNRRLIKRYIMNYWTKINDVLCSILEEQTHVYWCKVKQEKVETYRKRETKWT